MEAAKQPKDLDFDPTSLNHRQKLAQLLELVLDESGFSEEAQKGFTKEKLYSREVVGAPNVRVVVYTSIVGDAVRATGKDAIRVVALYKTKEGKDRPVAKAEKRVNRTGKFHDLTMRVIERMREVYKEAKNHEKCKKCGAPTFVSKKGNHVCSDLCFKTDPNQQKSEWKPKNLNHDLLCKKCGAPTFLSSKGNNVGSDFCWKNKAAPEKKETGPVEVEVTYTLEEAVAGLASF